MENDVAVDVLNERIRLLEQVVVSQALRVRELEGELASKVGDLAGMNLLHDRLKSEKKDCMGKAAKHDELISRIVEAFAQGKVPLPPAVVSLGGTRSIEFVEVEFHNRYSVVGTVGEFRLNCYSGERSDPLSFNLVLVPSAFTENRYPGFVFRNWEPRPKVTSKKRAVNGSRKKIQIVETGGDKGTKK